MFDVDFVASEVVFQPLHSDTATSFIAVRVSRCWLRMVSVPQHDDHRQQDRDGTNLGHSCCAGLWIRGVRWRQK